MKISDFFKRAHGEVAVVFDVGSSSVAGSLVSLSEGDSPKLHYTAQREFTAPKDTLDPLVLERAMLSAFNAVVDDLEKNGPSHLVFTEWSERAPRIAYCVLDAPWYVSHVRHIAVHRNRQFRVTYELFQSAIQDEIASIHEGANNSNNFHASVRAEDVEFLEQETTRVLLNKYEIDDPHDHMAKELDLFVYFSFAHKRITGMIRAALERAFHIEPEDTHIHSFSLALFSVIRDIWAEHNDFTLVSVGDEVTEAAVVRNGALFETLSFPFGKNSVIRAVAQELSVPFDETASLIALHTSGKAGAEVAAKLDPVLANLRGRWQTMFQEAALNTLNGVFVPRTLMLLADHPLEVWFQNIAKEMHMYKTILSEQTPAVLPITTQSFSDFLSFGSGADEDIFLAIDVLFANKMRFLGSVGDE